ncbi:phage virion morphogenesis protein [Aurantibacillus circumpalustris]|uniref:phage virion morphogenesis protein n=1 Tax=Aurantibacillus circumpalustris TaxID=3036359 RepID=UPI00295B6337|nr:phage virion morphogenesis protein [Aurantibacillus circumpalustris]
MYAHQARLFKRLPLRMSQWGLLEIKENFNRGGYIDESGNFVPWKKRSPNTWGKKNNNGRALLVLRARLKRSLKAAPLYNEARVITDVEYAGLHQNGFKGMQAVKPGKRTATVSRRVRGGYTGLGQKTRSKKVTFQGSRHNVKGFSRKVNIPARPFMEVGGTAFRQWENKILTEIDQLFLKS